MKRYRQIEAILGVERPRRILEIGTWNGDRAIAMCKAAKTNHYYGFDLFEEASDQSDRDEFNVKRHFRVDLVEEKLLEAGLMPFLIKGNTRETLPEYIEKNGEIADFAFIDGGHSVETIWSDLEWVKKALKPGSLILMDDFYLNMKDEFLDKFGANRVLESMEYQLLPQADPVTGGGEVVIAYLRA